MLDRGMSMPDSGIQSAMEMLPLKRGVLHIVVTAPPRHLADMCLADALVSSAVDCYIQRLCQQQLHLTRTCILFTVLTQMNY